MIGKQCFEHLVKYAIFYLNAYLMHDNGISGKIISVVQDLLKFFIFDHRYHIMY